MTSAALNMNVHVFMWAYVFISLCRLLGIEIMDHILHLSSFFKETAKLFSEVSVLFYILISNA